MNIDPVCGLEVNPNLDQSVYRGQTYYFCSTDCREEFDVCPEDYIGGLPDESA